MKHVNRRTSLGWVFKAAIAAFGLGAGLQGWALAQDYPNKPITLVVPFPPGGAVDGPIPAIAGDLSKRCPLYTSDPSDEYRGCNSGAPLIL